MAFALAFSNGGGILWHPPASEAFLITSDHEIKGVGAILGIPPEKLILGRGYFCDEASDPASAACFSMCSGVSRNPTRASVSPAHLTYKQEPKSSPHAQHSGRTDVSWILRNFQAQCH